MKVNAEDREGFWALEARRKVGNLYVTFFFLCFTLKNRLCVGFISEIMHRLTLICI